MMRKQWYATLMVLGLMAGGAAQAADHRDGPGVTDSTGDPTTDITDVYAWTSSDGRQVKLVMDIQGANTGATAGTRFSNSALYVFRLRSQQNFGGTGGTPVDTNIVCRFGSGNPQTFQCWGPSGEYVTDNVGNAAGKASTSGRMRVAALLREDPFPFNIRGFRATADTVRGAAGTLTFDAAGCPAIDGPTSQALVGLLRSDGSGGTGRDDFGRNGASPPQSGVITNGNVLAIVIVIDETLVNTGGPILRVWGSTNRPR